MEEQEGPAEGSGEGPVTVVFTWDVKPGREREFEDWADELHRVARGYSGHEGATWLRAEGNRHRYYTVLKFADQERLDWWLDSGERRSRIERLDGIAAEHRHGTTGLETWFSLPGESVPAPSKIKMIIVTLCAVYPLSIAFQAVIAPATKTWALPLRGLVFPIIMVPLLTLLVMPGLSRLLRRWLYPAGRVHRPARPGRPDR
ncbi:antibiotic biosynthesis monooxygenase [Actinomadura rubrisoli]|uniref:Antibiotic biosynthesis monooxygenase n=1 Tax=Actinomadura rubrisoli TaxID=2530368 RepID=A0A4R5C4J4_9ACTN|nr:antibiotic biosynthesis monooxygenase [Actinomadura rubrisoli]TDD94621.1 antibiotic biosynthesis monooxygenase [Actinomadura rubrisoli]